MGFLHSLECLCIKAGSSSIQASAGIIKAKIICDPASLRSTGLIGIGTMLGDTTVKPKMLPTRGLRCSPVFSANVSAKLSCNPLIVKASLSAIGSIEPGLTARYALKESIESSSDLQVTHVDKFAGSFGEFGCLQKLFPIADIEVIEEGVGLFVKPNQTTGNLFDEIDEGVFTGDYTKHLGVSQLLSNDKTNFIQPSSYHTEGVFAYKCQVSSPLVRPRHSNLRIRSSSPLINYESRIAPQYTFYDINFSDPSGNLIIQYNDIVIKGDSDHYETDYVNFATYASTPKINNAAKYDWEDDYPILNETGVYTLGFKLKVLSYDDSFDSGYNQGFEDIHNLRSSEIANLSGIITKNIRISAVEICNSGEIGPGVANYLNFYADVVATGRRIERPIYPIAVLPYGFNDEVYPSSVNSLWYANNDSLLSNATANGRKSILNNLRSTRYDEYVTLNSTDPIANSGKLIIKMGHEAISPLQSLIRGGFDFSFNGITGAYDKYGYETFPSTDGFFVVDSVVLKVLAKKQVGSRNYAIDVVGYSDDKILNITSKNNGFLQNFSGVGDIPLVSGFNPVDDLGISTEAISDASQYFQNGIVANSGGSHYLLSPVIVSGTSFDWYEVPLKVYEDTQLLGASRDHNMSSLFENLYLDIFPIPSGASIANLHLVVKYKPQNALTFITEGGERIRKIQDGRSEGKIFPSVRNITDTIINAGSGYGPLSNIAEIPHAYNTPNTLKSNYSRRWRGLEGTVNGPFDPDMFSFGFENPLLDFAFLSGFYDFDSMSGSTVLPRVGILQGTLTSSYATSKYKNLGWRFTDHTIFNNQLPGYTGNYQTTDWTSLSLGATNFTTNPLYGQIADAFNNVVRISGHNSYINFGNIGIDNGFSLYIRFTPDVNVSGVGYNLFNSGVLLSKWDSGKNLEFALGYEGGYLCGYSRDTVGTIHKAKDTTIYSDYQYPLSVIFTYNDHDSSGIKLYTDNEFEPNWTTLRASDGPFELYNSNSNFVVGNSTGSGVGMNMFISELGISNTGNIVYSDPDLTFKQVTAQKFLENNRVKFWDSSDPYTEDSYKLWDYVNEDTREDWHIGDFKYCEFGPAFDFLTKRTGRDLISFKINHHGSGYLQVVNDAMPSTIDSGVAYHTQVENDFLRFNLSDTSDNFHSTLRRITKDIPRGYKFAETALVVETVIEHESTENIIWSDGHIGPKFIVSLYTKNKEPYWVTDQPNWGLINRSFHYLEPSSCMMRLDSKFDYNSLIDESEKWSIFPQETRLTELTEKYFSKDIDDMFLQYDLVYPSGPAFSSRIDIHSAHIRMDDAYVDAVDTSGNLNLISSGNFPVIDTLNLMSLGGLLSSSGTLNLYTVGPIQIQESGLPLYTYGIVASTSSLDMFTEGMISISNFPGSGFNLVTSGCPTPLSSSGTLSLHALGKGIITSSGGNYLGVSLTSFNSQTVNIPGGNPLNLFTNGSSGNHIVSNIPLFTFVDDSYGSRTPANSSGTLNLSLSASAALVSKFPFGSMNLHTFNNLPSGTLNLVLYGDNYIPNTLNGSLNLHTASYGQVGQASIFMRWFNNNYGQDIDLEDNAIANKTANDEIRGVDIVGYGSCTGNSPRKAIDKAIITHDTVWRPETCNDGGIFRATDTYTNLAAGYSGNYYDIRKYTGLEPNRAYNVDIRISTGSTEPIQLPREWEEWEYGTNSTLAFSGVKLVGDYQSVSGRKINDNYGNKVVVKGDLAAVGSPRHTFAGDSGVDLVNAGSVFLYRRNEEVLGEKAPWTLEQKLLLPSGYRDGYSVDFGEIVSFPGIGSISGRKWNIGQEGRQFGSSIDIASSGDKEVVVIGAPDAFWNKSFDNIVTSGIPVAMILFIDKLDLEDIDRSMSSLHSTIKKNETLYKYFSAPWNAGTPNEFQPRIDLKVMIFESKFSNKKRVPISNLSEDWFSHTYIDRLDDPAFYGSGKYLHDSMLSGVIGTFLEQFPRNTLQLHSNIPPIVGVFQDNSASLPLFATDEVVLSFKSFYGNYSYLSGVIDPGPPIVGASGYMFRASGAVEDIGRLLPSLTNNVLDTGNLISNNALRFITSGIGPEWAQTNAYEFQIPPPSGGRVYIFEKENGIFNLIQEIKSPDEIQSTYDSLGQYKNKPKDMFGHSVSISKNTEVITIGSPYTTKPCRIYERNIKEETKLFNKLRDWLVFRGLSSSVAQFDDISRQSGVSIAITETYKDLNPTNKFYFRSDEEFWSNFIPTPYKLIFDYSYGDIPYTGSWQFITSTFAPTSRIGYSTAISEDGNTVAIGCPTDSFNEFEDTNVWYKDENTWASYVNAGAVRMFESRKYYPHNLAVEFYRFGNLAKNSHPEMAPYYEQLSGIFNIGNIPFKRTKFEENNIPENAGLAFIITPEIDATSDEIIDNIKDWLALGDRTLVLVGDDPIYEENGRYFKSNKIVNKILNKLGSRMRIYPARNEYESLQGCTDTISKRYNVTRSFVPDYAHNTYLSSNNIYANGVGDIRIDLSDLNKENFNLQSPCDEENDKCEMPLIHGGDLRSQWNSECVSKNGYKIKYKTNWPMLFGNDSPAKSCSDSPISINRPYGEPRPILTAAEYIPSSVYIIPAESGVTTVCQDVFETVTINNTYYEFANNQVGQAQLLVQEDINSNLSGIFSSYKEGSFYDPNKLNDRDPLLQATGISKNKTTTTTKTRELSDFATLCSEETYPNSTSKVILLASLLPENDNSMTAGHLNRDQNRLFYANLIRKSCDSKGCVKQLSAWTNRTSFGGEQVGAAYSKSELGPILRSLHEHYSIIENFNPQGAGIGGDCNILWIANPDGRPSNNDILEIKTWLLDTTLNNKRLVITYDNSKKIASNVTYLCEQLELNTKPYYSNSEDDYLFSSRYDLTNNKTIMLSIIEIGNDETVDFEDPLSINVTQKLNIEHPIIYGCGETSDNYTGNTRINKLVLLGQHDPNDNNGISNNIINMGNNNAFEFIPINVGNNTTRIIHYEEPVKESYFDSSTVTLWDIEAKSEIEFDVIPGSGYRLFFDWVAENVNDVFNIRIDIEGASTIANPEGPIAAPEKVLQKQSIGEVSKEYIDFRIIDDTTSIKAKFSSSYVRFNTEDNGLEYGSVPKTIRLISVSGCLLPIETKIATRDTQVKVGEICSGVPWYIPEIEVVIPEQFRPIKTDNTKYCLQNSGEISASCESKSGKLIEDGPIIVAEEFEHFSSFSAGSNRSRIVVISDSTIVQGQCPYYRVDHDDANQMFIRSLYPPKPSTNTSSSDGGRQFKFTQKILSPERGSPAKYFATSGIAGLVSKFGGNGVYGSTFRYTSDESSTHPGDISRPKDPEGGEAIKEAIKHFKNGVIPIYGPKPRFTESFDYILDPSGDPIVFEDAGIGGGIPDIMSITGKDHIDFNAFPSGYPGDLFGYSISIHENKLVIGSPFNGFLGETVRNWTAVSGNVASGLKLSGNGGAGAVFYFEKTGKGQNAVSEFLPWEFKQKIKPTSINIGIDNATIDDITNGYGTHYLDSMFILDNAIVTDKFGADVSIDADFVAIGAPGHDFETLHHHIYSGEAAYIRKEFNKSFNIPQHTFFDLGSSGVRIDQFNNASGTFVINNGAVFTYEHRITDWPTRTKQWAFAEKIVGQGYNSRVQTSPIQVSGSENDMFGKSVSLDRARRGDSDYTLFIGAPQHDYALSGVSIKDAGAAYVYDAMLRDQIPAIPQTTSHIKATVFGHKPTTDLEKIQLQVYQNATGDSIEYVASGLVFANDNGDIFLEASGFDPSTKGFISHRPYVTSVNGNLAHGTETDGFMNLYTAGQPVGVSGNMNLFMLGAPSAFVYNSMDLHTTSWNTINIGSGNTSFSLITSGTQPSAMNGSINLVTSGSSYSQDILNLRVRGK